MPPIQVGSMPAEPRPPPAPTLKKPDPEEAAGNSNGRLDPKNEEDVGGAKERLNGEGCGGSEVDSIDEAEEDEETSGTDDTEGTASSWKRLQSRRKDPKTEGDESKEETERRGSRMMRLGLCRTWRERNVSEEWLDMETNGSGSSRNDGDGAEDEGGGEKGEEEGERGAIEEKLASIVE
mmetsp:Transcript_31570/g.57360  ORF Transcript_31570/g.57360 Transcript_31570/m.57360 type:complete len:179 (+) Transcript_31570:25-561(+)